MLFGQKKTEPPVLDRERSLAGIPVRHPAIQTRRTATGGMVVTARFPRGRGLLSRFAPPMLEHRVELDDLGAFVMEHIDGKRSVLDIIGAFNERFSLNRREAELSTVAFIRKLAQRRLVSIVIP